MDSGNSECRTETKDGGGGGIGSIVAADFATCDCQSPQPNIHPNKASALNASSRAAIRWTFNTSGP